MYIFNHRSILNIVVRCPFGDVKRTKICMADGSDFAT